MGTERESLKPIEGADAPLRRRLGLRGELMLALLPTATTLIMLLALEVLSNERLLFASLASSAFLIYLDPNHGTNKVRTLMISHVGALAIGLVTFWVLGHGYPAAGSAMVLAILMMVLLDVVHPPAVATSLIFAFRAGAESEVTLFLLSLLITATLVVLQRVTMWLVARWSRDQ